MGLLAIHVPDPEQGGDHKRDERHTFGPPQARYVRVVNEADHPFRLTIHSRNPPRIIEIPVGETVAVHGHHLHRVEITALPGPRRGLMRFGR